MFIKKLINHYNTTVNVFDLLKSKNKYDKNKINLGWCSPFPPTRNGTAVMSYYIVKKLRERDDINLFLAPYEGDFQGKFIPPHLDKKMFKGFNVAAIGERKLDIMVLFLLGLLYKNIIHKVKAPFIIWQTLHDSVREETEKKLFAELTSYDYKRIYLTVDMAAREYKDAGARDVQYFPLCVDRTVFFPQDKTSNDFTVLFSGRAEKYKGIAPFLKAALLVLAECPEVKFKMHLPFDRVLKPDDEVKNLINLINEKYPGSLILNSDWSDFSNLNAIYKNVDLLVFISNNEGFGLPLIEAMSCGIPAIVLNKPPLSEIVKDNYNGFCLDLDPKIRDNYRKLVNGAYFIKDYAEWAFPSVDEIAEKIIYLYKNKEIHDKFSQNALITAQRYDINLFIDKLVSDIKLCLQKR